MLSELPLGRCRSPANSVVMPSAGNQWNCSASFAEAIRASAAFVGGHELHMSYARRIACLDGLRGIAAIAVMSFHFNLFFLPQARLFEIVPFVGRAYLAVDLFFLLSGFVMAHVYGHLLASNWRAHWSEFAIARFARIYPLFAVTTLAMILLFALSKTPLIFVSFSADSLVLQPFLLQQWASGLGWNYPSWSISTEAEAYLLFVFFAGLLLTGKYPRVIGACCFAVVAALSIAERGSLNLYVGIPALLRTLAEFSLGVLLYRAYSGDARVPRKWVVILLIIFVSLAELTHLDFLFVGAFGCLIYFCANATDAFGRLLDSRPFRALGNWSYSIYLWHVPTHYAVMIAFAGIGYPLRNLDLLSARLLLLVTALAVVGLSALHYQYFELPVRRFMLRSRATGEDHVAAAPTPF
jgi:peptidoglycan/LPS O-acetylase OafA/YrhL